MKLYRIVSESKHAVLNGEGAKKVSTNRWNSKGVKMVYTSESLEVAVAECGGHVLIGLMPDPRLIIIELEDDPVDNVEYPDGWDATVPGEDSQVIGDQFIEKVEAVALRVRSVRYDAYNILLNPDHPNFIEKVRIVENKPYKKD